MAAREGQPSCVNGMSVRRAALFLRSNSRPRSSSTRLAGPRTRPLGRAFSSEPLAWGQCCSYVS